MNLNHGTATINFHAYKVTPKSRYDAGAVKLDGKETPVKVTCAKHNKFPAYTYLEVDGQLYYAQGDLRGAELTTPVAKQEAAPQEAVPATKGKGK